MIFLEILPGLEESQFTALDLLFYLSKTAQFENGPGRLKPLVGRVFSGFAARKCPQQGEVEHFCAILKVEIACNAYAY